MNQRLLSSTGLLLLSVGTLAGACGTDFETCEETGTCGTPAGGTGGGGTASTGGAGASSGASSAGSAGAGKGGAAGSGGASASGGSNAGGGAGGDSTLPGGAAGEGGEAGSAASSGEGGDGGDSEAGGEGGSSGDPECVRDRDCQDELYCNGIETCSGGKCRPGPMPCQTPDPEHCTATCEEGSAGAVCMFEAVDADGDGFKTALCEANAGDDCDDGNDDIHPDATEICDAIDNDCDGKIDAKDGLLLAGQTQTITGGSDAQLAWFDAAEQFLLVYMNDAGLYKGALTINGTLNLEPEPIPNGAEGTRYPPFIAGGGTSLILGQAMLTRAGLGTYAWGLYSNGELSRLTSVLSNGNLFDFAWRSTAGDWVAAYDYFGSVRIGTVSSSFISQEGPTRPEYPNPVHIASTGAESAVVWQNDGTSHVQWARVSAALEISEPMDLSMSGYQPDIAAVPGGYALAWSTGIGIDFAIVAEDGTPVCESDVIDLDLAPDNGNAVALAYSERGVLALVTSTVRNKVNLVRFPLDCGAPEVLKVADANSPGTPSIDAGGGFVAFTWTSTTGGSSYVRLVSDLLCE